MGNQCKSEISMDEDNESFARMNVQPSGFNKIFSKTYKMEAGEEPTFNLDEIEFGFSAQFETRKKRNMSGTHFDSRTQYREIHKKLKPSLKQITHHNSLQREHSNKTVRWDSQYLSIDSLKQK